MDELVATWENAKRGKVRMRGDVAYNAAALIQAGDALVVVVREGQERIQELEGLLGVAQSAPTVPLSDEELAETLRWYADEYNWSFNSLGSNAENDRGQRARTALQENSYVRVGPQECAVVFHHREADALLAMLEHANNAGITPGVGLRIEDAQAAGFKLVAERWRDQDPYNRAVRIVGVLTSRAQASASDGNAERPNTAASLPPKSSSDGVASSGGLSGDTQNQEAK